MNVLPALRGHELVQMVHAIDRHQCIARLPHSGQHGGPGGENDIAVERKRRGWRMVEKKKSVVRRPATGVAGRQPPGIALPVDLDLSLRLLDDDQLDRLAKAVAEEARRRGHDAAGEPSVSERKSEKRGSAIPAKARPARAVSAPSITSGQERMILAALEAGLKPAAIAREFRLARATVQKVVDAARSDRRPQRPRQNG